MEYYLEYHLGHYLAYHKGMSLGMLLGISQGTQFIESMNNWSKTRDATWNTYWNIRVDITRNIAWSNLNTTTWDITWHTPQGMSLGIFFGTYHKVKKFMESMIIEARPGMILGIPLGISKLILLDMSIGMSFGASLGE